MVKILSAKRGGGRGMWRCAPPRVSLYFAARLGAAKGRVGARGYICARGECSANGLRGREPVPHGVTFSRARARARAVSGKEASPRAPLPPAAVTRARFISTVLLADAASSTASVAYRFERMCPSLYRRRRSSGCIDARTFSGLYRSRLCWRVPEIICYLRLFRRSARSRECKQGALCRLERRERTRRDKTCVDTHGGSITDISISRQYRARRDEGRRIQAPCLYIIRR